MTEFKERFGRGDFLVRNLTGADPERGALGVAALLRESADYARGIGASLRDQVYDALRHLAQGFLDYPGNRLAPEPATLKQIYDHSLIVLYRLLFILYAEARELLPLRESASYRADYSLDAIKREIRDDFAARQRSLESLLDDARRADEAKALVRELRFLAKVEEDVDAMLAAIDV